MTPSDHGIFDDGKRKARLLDTESGDNAKVSRAVYVSDTPGLSHVIGPLGAPKKKNSKVCMMRWMLKNENDILYILLDL